MNADLNALIAGAIVASALVSCATFAILVPITEESGPSKFTWAAIITAIGVIGTIVGAVGVAIVVPAVQNLISPKTEVLYFPPPNASNTGTGLIQGALVAGRCTQGSYVNPGRPQAIYCEELGGTPHEPCFKLPFNVISLNDAPSFACYENGPWKDTEGAVVVSAAETMERKPPEKENGDKRPWALEVDGDRCLRTLRLSDDAPPGTLYVCRHDGELSSWIVDFPKVAQDGDWTVQRVKLQAAASQEAHVDRAWY